MGILSYGYKGVVAGGKKVLQKLSGQGKTTGKEGIKFIKPGTGLTTKRAIQDKTVKAVDEGTKKGMKAAGAKPEFLTAEQKTRLRQSMSKRKRDESKKMKGVSYEYDRLEKKLTKAKADIKKRKKIKTAAGATAVGAGTATAGLIGKKIKDKRDKKMGGGMMGRRFGMKKGSKFPDLTGDGKVTFADILKGRGVINGKREKKIVGGMVGLGKAGLKYLKSKEGKEKLKEMSSEKNKKKIKDMASKMKKAFGGGSK